MNKLLLLLPFIGFLSCQPEDQPTDVAARASGRYAVQSYVVNGDTLYSKDGINQIGVNEFYVIVDRKKPDSVRVGSFYTEPGPPIRNSFIRDAGVSELNDAFQLSFQTNGTSVYECSIEGNTFYERTVRGGLLIIPPSYSLKTPATPALEGIIITAQK